MEQEIWKDVKGLEGYYQVSNLGNVRSIDRLIILFNGHFRYRKEQMILKRKQARYVYIELWKNDIQKKFRIHWLVAEAFITNSDNKLQVNHINGDKTDNRVENLEWCTASENQKHSYNNIPRKRAKAWKGKVTPSSKTILNILTGDVYPSIQKCAIENGLKRSMLNNMLLRKYPNKTDFRYVDNNSRIK